jgi:hypothetical protein
MSFWRKHKPHKQEEVDLKVAVGEIIKEEDIEVAIQAVTKKHGSWFVNTHLSVVRIALRSWLRNHLLKHGVSEEETEHVLHHILQPLSIRISAYFDEYHRSPGLEKKLGNMTTLYYSNFLNDVSGFKIKVSKR